MLQLELTLYAFYNGEGPKEIASIHRESQSIESRATPSLRNRGLDLYLQVIFEKEELKKHTNSNPIRNLTLPIPFSYSQPRK